MATQKQRRAARQNIPKAQAAWKAMSGRQSARALPEGRKREKPGRTGLGDFYHVAVRAPSDFVTFRTHDVGKPGHLQRVAGKRQSGSWDTQKWLIHKSVAHVERGRLVPDSKDAKELLDELRTKPRHVEGDLFEARPRRKLREREKPTPAQQRARRANIEKAQAAQQSHR